MVMGTREEEDWAGGYLSDDSDFYGLSLPSTDGTFRLNQKQGKNRFDPTFQIVQQTSIPQHTGLHATLSSPS